MRSPLLRIVGDEPPPPPPPVDLGAYTPPFPSALKAAMATLAAADAEAQRATAGNFTTVGRALALPGQLRRARQAIDAALDALEGAMSENDAGAPRTTLSDGSQVYPGHRQIEPATGQQKGYVVLAEEERAKGFVRPYRDAYRHDRCGGVTTMGRTLSETYARDPDFYSGTFCATCRSHFPVGSDGEFVWTLDGQRVGT